jgi:hypothetical protein
MERLMSAEISALIVFDLQIFVVRREFNREFNRGSRAHAHGRGVPPDLFYFLCSAGTP